MPILASDIKFKYSTKLGTAGNQRSGTAAGSLGKYISTTEITSAQLNNLFDDVIGDENAASDVKYRCIFVHNAHATLDLSNTKLWSSAVVAGGADILYARSLVGNPANMTKPIGQAAAQAEEIANENSVPGCDSFGDSTVKADGLSFGSSGGVLEAGYCQPIWIKRVATNSVALNNDGVTLKVEGDTPA